MASQVEDELTVKALQKRYDGLVTVRSRADKGKGAWYWAHLEPVLVQNQNTGTAKAVKLRCCFCAALFSASNPSRTASEHLKRGTCPNYNGSSATAKPLACAPPPSTPNSIAPPAHRPLPQISTPPSRKRNAPSPSTLPPPPPPSAISVDDMLLRSPSSLLSGGKEDLGALVLLEDSVKKLKVPSASKTGTHNLLSKGQIESALNLLAEWLYESCGGVSFSCMEHPKFKAFLNVVGLPPVSKRYLAGPKLDAKFEQVRMESESRLRDAMFFQLASDGWWKRVTAMGETLVNVTLNLPNGTSLFHKVITLPGPLASAKLAEETLWNAAISVCDTNPERCVGIVADADKQTLKALQELEYKNGWMVNLTCQVHGFNSLLKGFFKHSLLFRSVDNDCRKIIDFFTNKPSAWNYLLKLRGDDLNGLKLGRGSVSGMQYSESPHHLYTVTIAEDIANSAQLLQLAGMDDSFKMAFADDVLGRDVVGMMSDMRFWTDLEAVLSLVKLVKLTVQEVEMERPSVSQCLPLWIDFRSKVKNWSTRYDKTENCIDQVIEKRFKKNYHPAWSAAFILDPLYLIRDTSGKYLPPFKCLTADQEKDIDRLITRLVSHEEAPIAVMELLKWRTNGLDPLYAQAVQMKERDPATGKLRHVSPQSRRLVWETCLGELKVLGKVAVRLIFLHATSSSLNCNLSIWKWICRNANTRVAAERAQKMIYISSYARLCHKDFTGDEDKDFDLFGFDDDYIKPDDVFSNTTL